MSAVCLSVWGGCERSRTRNARWHLARGWDPASRLERVWGVARVTRVPRGAQLGRAWCFSPSLASLCYSLRLAKAVYGNYTHGAYTLRYTGHRVHPYGFTGTEYRVY